MLPSECVQSFLGTRRTVPAPPFGAGCDPAARPGKEVSVERCLPVHRSSLRASHDLHSLSSTLEPGKELPRFWVRMLGSRALATPKQRFNHAYHKRESLIAMPIPPLKDCVGHIIRPNNKLDAAKGILNSTVTSAQTSTV